jgi:hypothetical protein
MARIAEISTHNTPMELSQRFAVIPGRPALGLSPLQRRKRLISRGCRALSHDEARRDLRAAGARPGDQYSRALHLLP